MIALAPSLMSSSIIFIHGMFLNARSWEHWVPFFERRGFQCRAPSWPLHEGEPSELRASIPPGTGELSLNTVVSHFTDLVRAEIDPPILVGHSIGGLIVQKLVARGIAAAGVCISSVAPNALLSLDWNFLKNTLQISNPVKGDAPFEMTEEGFHANFGNMMTKEESREAYARYVVHESRNVLRDAIGKAGHIELDQPHAPLLFIAAEKDQIIPDTLNKKNADAYSDKKSITAFKEFRGRGHFICGQPGWEEVADYTANWISETIKQPAAGGSPVVGES